MNAYETAAWVNKQVNTSVTYKKDSQLYGKPEHWEPAGKYGDCEDYALLKRGRLLTLGWAPDKIGLVTCRLPSGEGHCVVWVDTNDGYFILDNIHTEPRTPSLLNYEWESMLCNGQWRQLLGWS